MLRGYILYLICEYLNEKDNYKIAKINKKCNKYIKNKYKDFRLTFKKYYDYDSFQYKIYIQNYDSKIFNHFKKKNDFRIPDDSYGLSKLIFNNLVSNLSKKYKCQFRIMRLFPVYGRDENSLRLYSTIKSLG